MQKYRHMYELHKKQWTVYFMVFKSYASNSGEMFGALVES